MANDEVESLLKALRGLESALPDDPSRIDFSQTTDLRRRRLKGEIESTIRRLEEFKIAVDPVQQPENVFDPADPETIGRLIGDTLLEQPRRSLDSLPRFYGSGVYALYSRSDFAAYALIKDTEVPIYLGKADPATMSAMTPEEQGEKLWNRLHEHAKSIRRAMNLKIADFECRFLVVRSAWQTTAENYLISRFQPVWNKESKVCHGFGKHGDAPETRANKRSPWDTLHPGREWATRRGNVDSKDSAAQISQRIAAHLEKLRDENPKMFERRTW